MFKTLYYTAGLLLSTTALCGTAHADTNGQPTTAEVHADTPGPVYHKEIFSQFAEHLGNGIYGGLWVGKDSKIPNTNGFRNDVIGALRDLSVPVIRWPGGCFADEYHWRDGIGPQSARPVKVNTNWDGVMTEPNTVGTHEYFELLRQVGAEAYVSGNVGTGSPRELSEWVEYMTAPKGTLADTRAKNGQDKPWRLPYVGIGNELWGCGGFMRPEYAADLTRHYASFVKVPSGTRTMKIASGPNVDDYAWTEGMMRVAGKSIDGLALHYYVMPGAWPPRLDPIHFDETDWANTLQQAWRMDELITKHSAIMDKYDPDKRVFLAVDEWGAWYAEDPGTEHGFLRQQNTMRDALIAAINLDIFAKHADRVRMTAIAQMVNVLQAMILTDGDKMVLTPTYHVFEMYKPWQDAAVLPIKIDTPTYAKGAYTIPAVSGSAVKGKDGAIHIGLSNADPEKANTVTIKLDGANAKKVSGRILTAPAITSHNTFAKPDTVKPVAFPGARLKGDNLVVDMPARSVVVLDLR